MEESERESEIKPDGNFDGFRLDDWQPGEVAFWVRTREMDLGPGNGARFKLRLHMYMRICTKIVLVK